MEVYRTGMLEVMGSEHHHLFISVLLFFGSIFPILTVSAFRVKFVVE